jgi:hypothetical protein
MYVIFSRADGHVIDTARTLQEAQDKSWWRTGVKVSTASWYQKYVIGV